MDRERTKPGLGTLGTAPVGARLRRRDEDAYELISLANGRYELRSGQLAK
jgi:hypothetical protein